MPVPHSTAKHIAGIILPVLLVLSGATQAEQGDDSAFLQQRSQHAFNAVFGLPTVAPRLVQTLEWQVSMEHSNQFAGGISGAEQLRIDGETTRVSINLRQRLSSCWQVQAAVPLVSHSPGRFDRAIDDWHKFFGLPDAQRDASSFDVLQYQYSDEQGLHQSVLNPQSGLGDVQIAVQYALGCFATADSTRADQMLRVGIKLPTGDPDDMLGSGGADIFADWQSPVYRIAERYNGGLALGLLIIEDTPEFVRQESAAVYGSASVQYRLSHNLRLIAQLDGHTSFYKSGLRELGAGSINLAVGARYLKARSYSYEFSISEDVMIDTTPDIVARLAITYRPDQTQ